MRLSFFVRPFFRGVIGGKGESGWDKILSVCPARDQK